MGQFYFDLYMILRHSIFAKILSFHLNGAQTNLGFL